MPFWSGVPAGGTYTISVIAIIPDDNSMKIKEAFSFNLQIDCCASPTIITSPSTAFLAYEYTIGEPVLDIALNGSYTSDNTCCGSIPVAPLVISQLVPPIGMFTQPDLVTNQVNWTDVTPGFEGVYQISYSPDYAGCNLVSTPVEYTVEIINECYTVQFIIDAVFSAIGTNTMSHIFAGNDVATLQWNSVSSIALCTTTSVLLDVSDGNEL